MPSRLEGIACRGHTVIPRGVQTQLGIIPWAIHYSRGHTMFAKEGGVTLHQMRINHVTPTGSTFP